MISLFKRSSLIFVLLVVWMVNTILPSTLFEVIHSNNQVAFSRKLEAKDLVIREIYFTYLSEIQLIDQGKELVYHDTIYDIVQIKEDDSGLRVTCSMDLHDTHLYKHRKGHEKRKGQKRKVVKHYTLTSTDYKEPLKSDNRSNHGSIHQNYSAPCLSTLSPPPDFFIFS